MKDYNYDQQAEYYDIIELDESNKQFNEVLDGLLKKFQVKTILDISCGTGLQSIFLAKKEYKIIASDYNKNMLSMAKRKAGDLKIDFKEGDMRTANYGKFDAVISIFNAIGHLSKSDFEKTLINIKNNLTDKGIFIFDIFNLDFMKNYFIGYEFIDKTIEHNGTKFVRFNKNKISFNDGLMTMNQKTFIQKGLDKPQIIKEIWNMQIYSTKELKIILEKNGFEVLDFLNMNGEELDQEKNISILTIARKK
jgi:SAM-dependent methyltransferase